MTNQQFAKMLRRLAAAYEQHEELAQFAKFEDRTYWYIPDKPALAAAVRALGPGKKGEVNDCLNYQPEHFPFSLWASKSALGCVPVEETIYVPEQVIPATQEKVIPAHTEKRITYKCEPILGHVEDTEPKLLAPPDIAKEASNVETH